MPRGFRGSAVVIASLCLAAPLDAQYQRGVLVHNNLCSLESTARVSATDGTPVSFRDPAYGVQGLAASSGIVVTVSGPNSAPLTVRTASSTQSVLVSGLINDANTCVLRIETIQTERLASWAKQNADEATREARKWSLIRNTLVLGGVAVFGATLANFSNEVEREGEGDGATLLLGSALGLTITWLGFSEASPEVSYYRDRQARYRFLEREITQRAR